MKVGAPGLKKYIFLDIYHKSLCPNFFFLIQSKKSAKNNLTRHLTSDLTFCVRSVRWTFLGSLGFFKLHFSNCKHNCVTPRCPELMYVQYSDIVRFSKIKKYYFTLIFDTFVRSDVRSRVRSVRSDVRSCVIQFFSHLRGVQGPNMEHTWAPDTVVQWSCVCSC